MRTKSNLDKAMCNKNDEYYTYDEDVAKVLEPYKEYLKGKRVLCPCDTDESNFVKYLKELECDIIAYYKENGSEWFKPDNYDICRPFVNGVEKYTRLVIRRNLRGK